MSPSREFSAVVLAAGRSTRMGRDKALLEIDGVPLWQRQRELLVGVGAKEIFLSARPEQTWARAAVANDNANAISRSPFAAVLHDALPSAGPLCGITAALERMTCGHLAVVAVDLPRMSAAWFETRLAECAPGVGAVGRRGNFFEPLAAIYPRELLPLAWERLTRGEYALQSLIDTAVNQGVMRVAEISSAETPWFENWNEPVATS